MASFKHGRAKREPGEPNADNYDGRRGVCPGLSIGVTDGQIKLRQSLDDIRRLSCLFGSSRAKQIFSIGIR